MDANSRAALVAKFSNIEITANPKTMEEMVQYIEENWKAQRIKIKESHYNLHFDHAQQYMREMGKDPESVQDEIRRYGIPNTNNICIIFGMQSEYITVENGMKYYQALTLLKGLTQEDIDTKNDRWLQYMILLEMQPKWEAQEAAYKAALAESRGTE